MRRLICFAGMILARASAGAQGENKLKERLDRISSNPEKFEMVVAWARPQSLRLPQDEVKALAGVLASLRKAITS